MIKCLLLSTALFCALAGNAQISDSLAFKTISDQVLTRGKCYEDLKVLCKTVGNRISGSPQAAKAVEWGEKTMRETGCDKVWLQPVMVPVWKRGEEHLALKFSGLR